LIGSVLDKYEVLQKVGEGGMATVYRGRHTTLGRDVAIKVLHPHLSSSTRNRKRFAREARAIEQLRHENILEIYDYSGNDTEDCYIVTEFVAGETLTELMNRTGKLPSEVVAMIGLHLAQALEFAHAQGVLHRDLKPDNVMIRADGTVKLMDFGIARFLDESQVTMTGALVGSPAYMSPEQAREGELDARSDLFSLGTVLFFLVTGHLPFSGSNPSLILKNIIEGNRPAVTELAPSMSASLADVVERLLQKDREARFNGASELKEPLRRVLEEVGVDPARPEWALGAFVTDPEAWNRRLDAHLRTALLDHGKRYLGEGDHLAALRLFNRLLSIDEDNAEVLALVQGLHAEPDTGGATTRTRTKRRVAGTLLVVAAVALAAAAAAAVYVIGGEETTVPPAPAEPPTAAIVEVPPPAPAAVVAPPSADPGGAAVEDPPAEGPPATAEPEVPAVTKRRLVIPTTARPPETLPPVDNRPAKVTFRATPSGALWAWAEVYCDGKPVGQTRPEAAVELPLGVHECRYTSKQDHIVEDTFTLELNVPGEAKLVEREVRPKPLEIAFEGSCPAECSVTLDGTEMGTVSGLGRMLTIREAPDKPHTVSVTCPTGSAWKERFTGQARPFPCGAP
jgi:tRNA A-37 threonylcarbamoyl transferase component Bud32